MDQVAAELLCSPSKVSRLETGQRGATLRDIRDLCNLYGVTEAADRERLMTLARDHLSKADTVTIAAIEAGGACFADLTGRLPIAAKDCRPSAFAATPKGRSRQACG